ncbi:MAG: hypothetical protein ACREPQ_09645 [Rhodanobacter sp.]
MENEFEDERAVEINDKAAVLVDGKAEEVIAAIAEEKDADVLVAALEAEKAGKSRVTVVAALDAALTPEAKPIEVKEGHALLKAPKGASSASVGGTEYPVEDGHIQVPAHLAHELHPHGFVAKAD